MNGSTCRTLLLTVASTMTIGSTAALGGVINFDNLSDSTFVTTQYAGLTFTNTIVLTSGISLNELDFPPRSGLNVASDSGGAITILFSSPISNFLSYFTYTVPVTIQGFSASNILLASATSLFSTNTLTGGSVGSVPNELLQIASGAGITRIVITGDPAGGSFTLDDATFTTGQVGVAPEPSMLALTGLSLVLLVGFAKRRF